MNNLTIRNAKIIFRNFSGKGSQFNPQGRRNFSVIIEDENLANDLINDGWNLKPLKKRDENDPQHWHLPVAVNYGAYPPTIILKSGKSKTYLEELTVQMLDWADIVNVDLTIRPRIYEIAGQTGIKAYLKTMGVVVEVDEIAAEYADVGDGTFTDEEDTPF